MEIVLQTASFDGRSAPRRGGRAVVLGAAVAIGSCSLAGCGDASDQEPKVPALAAATVMEEDVEEVVAEPPPAELELELEAEEGRVDTLAAAPGLTPDPLTHRGTTTAGSIDAHLEDDRCRGWLAPTPDFVFDAQRPFAELAVMVASEADTTLFIIGPDGEPRCSDDEDGTQPVVRGLFGP